LKEADVVERTEAVPRGGVGNAALPINWFAVGHGCQPCRTFRVRLDRSDFNWEHHPRSRLLPPTRAA